MPHLPTETTYGPKGTSFGTPQRGVSGKFYASYPKREQPPPKESSADRWWWGPLKFKKDSVQAADVTEKNPANPFYPCFATIQVSRPPSDIYTYAAMKKRASATVVKREEVIKKAIKRAKPSEAPFTDYIQFVTGINANWKVMEIRPVIKRGVQEVPPKPTLKEHGAIEVVLAQTMPECNVRVSRAFPLGKVEWRKDDLLPEDMFAL